MSDVTFDEYPPCLSWQVLNRIEEGRLTEPVLFFIRHYIHYKTITFLFNSALYFPHNYDNYGQRRKRGIGVI